MGEPDSPLLIAITEDPGTAEAAEATQARDRLRGALDMYAPGGRADDAWFGGLPDMGARGFAIALAVLNGLPFEQIVRAAHHLGGPEPFEVNRRDLLRMLGARTREKTEPGEFGPTPVEVIEYLERDRPRAVLDEVWHQYQFQRPLLDWLRGLATDPSLDVRIHAGTALGVLSTYAFDFVHSHALRSLADDDNPWSWDVLAYALRVPARDDRLFPLVRQLANRLQRDAGQPRAQAAAARVQGLALGPVAAEESLDRLDRLAVVDDWRVAWGIGAGLADLLVDDSERHAPDVLRRVAQWQADPRRTIAAQYAFLYLARNVRSQAWPGLLLLADRLPALRPVLIACWVRVLNSGAMEPAVAAALNGWAELAESYGEVRLSFVRLLKAVAATGPRSRAIVLRHAATWVWPDTQFPLPETAAAVTEALTVRTDG
ncbi:MAG: hypothetical protein ABW022_02675 [Actinoplanes sp.]